MFDVSSFLRLFTRGRYVSGRSIARNEARAADKQSKHQERERFGVAAIAFCLDHDLSFRRHFLGITTGWRNAKISFEIEPERWGDLVLRQGNHIVVLEFKLGALLGEHQDPREPLFTKEGYGSEIRSHFGGKELVRYLVIGRQIKRGITADGLEYCGLPWSAFLSEKESGLETDLYDCLAVLGASIFVGRKMKKRSLTVEARGALEVYELLKNAAGDIPTVPRSASGSIGLDLLTAGATDGTVHADLKNAVQAAGRTLGWIGYEDLDEFSLSAWFYCSSKAKNRVRKRLQGVRIGTIDEDGDSIGVHVAAARDKDHVNWIGRALRAVSGRRG